MVILKRALSEKFIKNREHWFSLSCISKCEGKGQRPRVEFLTILSL